MRMRSIAMIIVTAAVLLTAVAAPGPAQQGTRRGSRSRPGLQGHIPMPMLMGRRDAELTGLARDIVILRAINSLKLTKDQIEKTIPILEQVVAADQRLRENALQQLRAERARLLAGTATGDSTRQAMTAIADARQRYSSEIDQLQGKLSQILNKEQTDTLRKIVAGAPGPGMRPEGRPESPAPPEMLGLRTAEMSPSAQATEHIVDLLKEKLAAMKGA
jgi:hypothetical protein